MIPDRHLLLMPRQVSRDFRFAQEIVSGSAMPAPDSDVPDTKYELTRLCNRYF